MPSIGRPKPNRSKDSGASAIDGIERSDSTTGRDISSEKRDSPSRIPTSTPTTSAIVRPNRTASSVCQVV